MAPVVRAPAAPPRARGPRPAPAYNVKRQVMPPRLGCMDGLLETRWLTADVLGLARGIYEKRAFQRMPILADALMDAGCEEEVIIGHCRGKGRHVRGCWLLDLVLGKE